MSRPLADSTICIETDHHTRYVVRRRFDATEVEDPNVIELPVSAGGGSLLFFTGAWVAGDEALNCTDGDQPQPDSAKLANAQRIGVAYRCGFSNSLCIFF